jgi:hypothetical protein
MRGYRADPRRYANEHIILASHEIQSIPTFLMSREVARRLMMSLLLSGRDDEFESVSLVRHSRWSPYPALEIIEQIPMPPPLTPRST